MRLPAKEKALLTQGFSWYEYVNKNHIIYASELAGTEINIYKVHLTNGRKLFIDDDDFNKILKEM